MSPITKLSGLELPQNLLAPSGNAPSSESSSEEFSDILAKHHPEVEGTKEGEKELEENAERAVVAAVWQLFPEILDEKELGDHSFASTECSVETANPTQPESSPTLPKSIDHLPESAAQASKDSEFPPTFSLPQLETNAKPAEKPNGMADAKQTVSMLLELEQDKIAEPGRLMMQPLPLLASKKEVPIPVVLNLIPVIPDVYLPAAPKNEIVQILIPDLAVKGPSQAEAVVKSMHEQILLIKDLKRSEMQVVIGPSDQPLNLHLKQATPGVVTIEAWCDSNGYEWYKDQWAELQKAMDTKGVVLDSLQLQNQSGQHRQQPAFKQLNLDEVPPFRSSGGKEPSVTSEVPEQFLNHRGLDTRQQWWA